MNASQGNPVVQIDGVTIGDGKPGHIAKRLRNIYIRRSRDTVI